MSEDYGEFNNASFDDNDPVTKKDNKLWIIIAIVALVLCCFCLALGAGLWWLWNNGDALLGLSLQLNHLLL